MKETKYKAYAETLLNKLNRVSQEVGNLEGLPTQYETVLDQIRYDLQLNITGLWLDESKDLIMIRFDRESARTFSNLYTGSFMTGYLYFNKDILIFNTAILNRYSGILFVVIAMLYKNILSYGKVAEAFDISPLINVVTLARRLEKSDSYGRLHSILEKWIDYKPELAEYLPQLIAATGTRRPDLIGSLRNGIGVDINLIGAGSKAAIVDYKLVIKMMDNELLNRFIDLDLVIDLKVDQFVELKRAFLFDPAIWYSEEPKDVNRCELITILSYCIPDDLRFYKDLDSYQYALEQEALDLDSAPVCDDIKVELVKELLLAKELIEKLSSKIDYLENRIREL